jgi:hypothetical protein
MRLSYFVCMTMLAVGGSAFAVDRTWGGGSNGPLNSGSFNWNVPGNWSGDNVPDGAEVAEKAVIGDASGNRTITMNVPAGISSAVDMTQTSNFVNQLTLNGNITFSGAGSLNFTNTSPRPVEPGRGPQQPLHVHVRHAQPRQRGDARHQLDARREPELRQRDGLDQQQSPTST